MNCNTAQNLLSAFLDAELSGTEMARVRRHLAECECCQREETELRVLKSLLTDVPIMEPPAGFEEKLCSTVFASRSESTVRESWPLLSGIALVAAALTLFAFDFAGPEKQTRSREHDVMALELQRDQTSLAGADPFLGSSTVISTDYVGQ